MQDDVDDKLLTDTEEPPSESDLDNVERPEELANPDTLRAKMQSSNTLRAEKLKRKQEALQNEQSKLAKLSSA